MAESADPVYSGDPFRKSMEEALRHLDLLKDTLIAQQKKAIDQEIAAKEELKRIEHDADRISRDFIEENRKVYLEQVRNEVLQEVLRKLILAGIPSNQLKICLDLSPEALAKVWHYLNFEILDDLHVGHVAYSGTNKAGEVIFYRNDCMVRFPYELGQDNIVAVVDIPSEEAWETATGLANADRQVTLEFIANRMVKDQAPDGQFMIYPNRIEIKR